VAASTTYLTGTSSNLATFLSVNVSNVQNTIPGGTEDNYGNITTN
jgi:hypothetical protein